MHTYNTKAASSSLKSEDAAKMLDTGSTATVLDYLVGPALAASRARAGRASGLADAANMNPGLTVKYPLLAHLAAGGAGSLAGGRVASTPGRYIGGMLGNLLATIFRRRNINRIQTGLKDKDLQQIYPRLGSFLLPFTAPTHRGHTDVYQALRKGVVPSNMGRRDVIESIVGGIPLVNILGDLPVRAETATRLLTT